MGFLDFITGKSRNSALATSVARQVCEIIRPEFGGGYTDGNSVEKYRSWVYVASTHNARNVADAELYLFSNKTPKAAQGRKVMPASLKEMQAYEGKLMKDAVEIESHPILDLLNRPNPRDTFYDLIYKTDLFLELTGDAYWHITRDDRGVPVQLDVLYSQYVNIMNDGLNRIIKYNYGIPQDGIYQYNFDPADIIHFKFFDPEDIFHGISPLQACARSYGLIESMNTYEEALNRNMGVPSGMLKYLNASIKPEDRDLIESKWQRKFGSVGRAGKLVVTDQNVEYSDIGVKPRDMQFLDGRKWSREEILACFGVNPALLLTEDVNRSNMIQASVNYHHNTLTPRLKLITQTINRRLIAPNALPGTDLMVVLRKEKPQDEEMALKKAELLGKHNAVTVNELRHSLGQAPLEGAAGNKLVGDRNEEQA